jgi:hypothetical protein
MDDVQPGMIIGRRGHGRQGHFRVAPGTDGISVGVGRGWAIWRAVQAVRAGFKETVTPKHGDCCSICRGGLQVLLPTEREGLVCPASHRSSTIEDVFVEVHYRLVQRQDTSQYR